MAKRGWSGMTNATANMTWLIVVLELAACSGSHPQMTHQRPARTRADSGVGSKVRDSGASSDAAPLAHSSAGDRADAAPQDAMMPQASFDAASPGADAGCCDAATSSMHDATVDCGSVPSSLEMIDQLGNVVLVWDRSTSMMQDWNGQVRWQAAGNALISALTPLASDLSLAAIFFPSVVSSGKQRDALAGAFSCDVDAYDSVGQIPFMAGPDFLRALQKPDPSGMTNPIYGAAPAGGTPTYAALVEAGKAIDNATLQGKLAVVLVTDGEPTCNDWNQPAATTLVSRWLSTSDIKTYVIGLPSSDLMTGGQPLLNAVAQAGGTTQYVSPTDAMALQQTVNDLALETKTSRVSSCSIELTTSVPAAQVQLVVTEHAMNGPLDELVPHDLGSGAGWTISADGKHAELTGVLCDDAIRGRFTSIRFAYACGALPEITMAPPRCEHVSEKSCNGACVRLTTDHENCGKCGSPCRSAETCCGGVCVDTSTNAENCGSCRTTCGQENCCAGQCKPQDIKNCGGCGLPCSGSNSCCMSNGGHFECMSGICP
jgi:hypothetical protein